jgi:hypothetical protein
MFILGVVVLLIVCYIGMVVKGMSEFKDDE